MLVHTVLFWLKEDLDDAQRSAFHEALEALSGTAAAAKVYIGTPAETPKRPTIDDTYDFCLTVLLQDMEAHDAYQLDPLHTAFLEKNRLLWKRVQIYDAA